VRVVIDARAAVDPRPTGVGVYARRMVRHLPPEDPSTRYTAWYVHGRGLWRPRRFFDDARAPNLRERPLKLPSRIVEPMANRLGVPRVEWSAGAFDALLATNFLPPATASRSVVMVVHDLAFEVLGDQMAPHLSDRWRRLFDRWLSRAAAVVVPSNSTRDDLLAGHAVDPVKVRVVPLGVDVDEFAPAPPAAVDDVRERFGVDRPYALFVGGVDPRKNLDALVRAYASVEAGTQLVIAGGAVRWNPEADERFESLLGSLDPEVRSRIVRTGWVNDTDKVALLSGATLLAFPSLYEGFGFPVLEAFAAGVPVLTSSVSALPEVAGDAAILVDPRDETAIAAGLAQLFGDADLRGVLSAAGLVRAAGFTWERCAKTTVDVLHGVAESGR
jgi:glycosyltransferase involved in cell wall biosynthesis